ncbi:hypothetical protein LTR12_001120 [Friedmanniomyces endolithicus]|nr:hypothetical protein LTR74_005076 [Friedmanniomyces endolithicus]KAK1824528.1 hypothetical protein LTR12_001120 [Friedmanniomyces endolithicus]
MTFQPLLRRRALPIAGLTAGLALLPKTTAYAEEPVADPAKAIRLRKPIYDTPLSEPTATAISATTPLPASGITDKPQEENASRRPTPTDRLAKELSRGRLFLHRYAVKTEDGLNAGMDRFMSAEHSFTSTIASLAPPKESNEQLLPGSIYVLVAAMAGSIISRNRNILIRFVTPIITGVTTANYMIPRTTQNVGNLIWDFEKQYPVVRDNHLRISQGIRHFIETGKAHSQMGLAMAEERVTGARETMEDWVKKGRWQHGMDGGNGTDSNAQLVTDDFKIKGTAIRHTSKDKSRDVAPETCTICLESITERAVAAPCNHLTFDFLCLVSWLQERPTCPLCKALVTEVQYDWRGPEDYKTYRVPKQETAPATGQGRRQGPSRRFAAVQASTSDGRPGTTVEDPALHRRRQIYREKTYSLHVGTNPISQYHDFTSEAFAASADLQSQARAFLRRELKVFSFLDATRTRRGGNTREFLVEYIIAVLKVNEIKGAGGHAEDLVAEFLGMENARMLLHELEAWLRSPFGRLEAWDEQMQYRNASTDEKQG